MNLCRFFIAIIIGLPMSALAQKVDSIPEVQSQQISQPMVSNTVVEALSATIQKLTEENKALQLELNQLKKSKTQTIENTQKKVALLLDSLKQTKGKLDYKINEQKQLKSHCDSLEKVLTSIGDVVYKECLLYPLSIRYNQKRIDECLQALSVYCSLVDEAHRSENLKQCIRVYKPFLEKSSTSYLTYTQELVTFLERASKELERLSVDPDILKAIKLRIEASIKNLKYYAYYSKRNTPPYCSIEFLDHAIDHLLLLLKESRNISQDMNNLKESLVPKL